VTLRRLRLQPLVSRDPFGGLLLDWQELPRGPAHFRELFDLGRLPVEELVEDGKLVIRADLPGIDPDKDVELTVADGLLRIHAERREQQRVEGHGHDRSELRYGSLSRTVPLPAGTTATDVVARYDNWVLEVRVLLEERKAETVRIPVTRS
jgi:HSP20 family protein